METTICTLCEKEKALSEFYKNNRMPSGYANQCKECVKARAKKREFELRKDTEWVEKEKERARDKYKRLGYNEKQKHWNKKRPWVNTSDYRNLHRDLKIKEGETAHHWNYNLLKDVFILDKALHRKIHRFMTIDEDSLCFRTIEGTLLDTRKKHENYINNLKTIS